MRVLLTNDDGIESPGLIALEKYFSKKAQSIVVAPHSNRSATGHSLSLQQPIRMEKVSESKYAVSSFPADCVRIAIMKNLLKGKPDLVISGINHGSNMGQDVYYSGTIAAAREAASLSIPSIAISLKDSFSTKLSKKEYDCALKVLDTVILWLKKITTFKKKPFVHWPHGMIININVPNIPYSRLKGIHMTKQGYQIYNLKCIERVDHRRKLYYWTGGSHKGFKPIKDSDCVTVDKLYASVTPLKLDCTDYDFLEKHKKISL